MTRTSEEFENRVPVSTQYTNVMGTAPRGARVLI